QRPIAIAVALVIATVKAALVAGVFMHLISEKKVIYAVLILTAAFFLLVLLLPSLTIFEGVAV
ncbi:MAG TPA: cytochrome C oxidase subunit IV family protein, partial [Myxococcales bacterium]|nr:cytochrome C oxidase subunit IV family protein [Myxococcales bacterium]